MRVSVLQEHLAKGVATVARAVAAKSTLPVLGNVLLSTDEAGLKLSATNLELAITCWVETEVLEPGSITVPAKLFAELVNSMPPEKVDLHLNARNRTLQIHCGRYEANIKGIDAEEYPPVPSVGDDPLVQIEASALRKAVSEVVFSAAPDDTRPVLAGVFASIKDDKVTLVAADGFRLSVTACPLARGAGREVDIIIPARALNEVARVIGADGEVVDISVTGALSQAMFRIPGGSDGVIAVELISRLIEGTFPNYQQIIPKSHSTTVEIGTTDFTKAARVASFFARDASNVLRLQVVPGQDQGLGELTVSAVAAEVGDTATPIEAIVNGDQMQIAFNAKYLLDVLAVVSEQRVVLELSSPSSPGLVRPLGDSNFIHIIMPMHTSGR